MKVLWHIFLATIELLLLYQCCSATLDSTIKGFDDSILYSLVWPGADISQDNLQQYQELVVQSDKKEKYKCLIPHVLEKEKDLGEKYSGPNPLDLLSELFSQPSCSYRLEPYWTYELCHGKYIRQYHEEREGKKAKLQEFYLGRWDKISQDKLREALESEDKTKPGSSVPVKKIDGLNMPYVQVNMSDGTQCDLSSKPRSTKVLYVCYTLGKHEIYSIKETSICEYEIIVLSPLLCSHPRYRPLESSENSIKCIPLEDAGAKPVSLLKLEAESLKLRTQKVNDGIPRVRVEMLPLNGITREDIAEAVSTPLLPMPITDTGSIVDNTAYNNFITGRDCIQGGSGWWKYEFCYGRSVIQYHVEKGGAKTTVTLGNFIKSGHLKWLAANPHKRPVVGSQVSYLYTKGTICEETGLPRQTEIKLKCVEHRSAPASVSLYLLEPRTCNYVLGVESQHICTLLQHVDEDGLLVHEDTIGFSKADYEHDYQPTDAAAAGAGTKLSKEKKKDSVKVTLVVMDEDNLDNHIPDGDE